MPGSCAAILAALSVVLGLTLAGCGGSSGGTGQPRDTGRETSATPTSNTGRTTAPPSGTARARWENR